MNKHDTMAKVMAESQTIAVVGFSSKEQRAGYYVPAYLAGQGYRIFPVNPNLAEGLGQPAYPDLLSIPEPVDQCQSGMDAVGHCQ
mgnify:CR=1 FL=1